MGSPAAAQLPCVGDVVPAAEVSAGRAPSHARQRADLRQKQTRHRARDRGDAPREPGCDDHEDAGDPQGSADGLDGHDAPLAQPVGARTPEGRTDGVGHGERAGAEAAGAVAAGGGRDEQEGAQLAHGERHTGEEGDDDVRAAGEAEEVAVRVDG